MANSAPGTNNEQHYPIVGRDNRIDLQKYTTRVHGRDIIDYEKLKAEDPTLYQAIVRADAEANRRQGEHLKELLSETDK